MGKVKEFYERNDAKWEIRQKGIMGKLFHLFEKYNVWRSDVAVKLISKDKNRNDINTILDVGCARWHLLASIVNNIDNVKKVQGIDINENRIADAKKKFDDMWIENNIQFMDINKGLDYQDNSIDLVTCLAVLEHVFDPIFVVEEFSRILKKDGVLIIEVPNIVVFFRRIAFMLWIRPRTSWDEGWDGWHLAYFTVRDLKKLFEEKWFVVEKVTGSGIFAWVRSWWVNMLSADIIIQARKK